MHELGHNLGLRHGGFEDEPLCKPNYRSVMSYRYGIRGVDTNCDHLPERTPESITYSSASELCTNNVDDDGDELVDIEDPDCFLDEAHLNEEHGVCGHVGVDWDGDGFATNADVEKDVNDDLDLQDGHRKCRPEWERPTIDQFFMFSEDQPEYVDDWHYVRTRGMKAGAPRKFAGVECAGSEPCLVEGQGAAVELAGLVLCW